MAQMPIAKCQAARLHEYGGPIQLDAIVAPSPGRNDVLVQVAAAGVNPVDWKIQAGLRRERMPLELPVTLGCDIAGTVIARGDGVSDIQVGDRVMAMVGLYGAFQERVSIPSSRAAVIPSVLSFEEAAAIPLPALTAWQALQLLQPHAGERLLIHGAGGSVGGFAVQLAKRLALEVVGTASQANHAYLHSLGAAQLLDCTRSRFEAEMGPVDLVLDLAGGDTQRRSWGLLRAGGRLVSAISVPEPGADGRPHEVQAHRVGVQSNGAHLALLAGLAAQGLLRPRIARVCPLSDVEQVLSASRRGDAVGKSVLRFAA